MRRNSALSLIALIVLMAVVLPNPSLGDPFAVIRYQLFHWETDTWVEYVPGNGMPPGGDQPGTNLWRYDYIIYNWGTPQAIQQAYLFFNPDNMAMDATWAADTAPAGWTTAQVGPFDPDFNWKERYRASGSAYYIPTGDSLEGVSVEFTWTKSVIPGNQIYDAVYSGGSESGLTLHKTEPVAAAPSSWGDIKRFYR
jgi:hypothetical protein